jgi:hypothetical protein
LRDYISDWIGLNDKPMKAHISIWIYGSGYMFSDYKNTYYFSDESGGITHHPIKINWGSWRKEAEKFFNTTYKQLKAHSCNDEQLREWIVYKLADYIGIIDQIKNVTPIVNKPIVPEVN